MRGLRGTQNCPPGRQRESQKLGGKKGGNFSYPSPFLPKKEALRVGTGFVAEESRAGDTPEVPVRLAFKQGASKVGQFSSNPYSKS